MKDDEIEETGDGRKKKKRESKEKEMAVGRQTRGPQVLILQSP